MAVDYALDVVCTGVTEFNSVSVEDLVQGAAFWEVAV